MKGMGKIRAVQRGVELNVREESCVQIRIDLNVRKECCVHVQRGIE